MNNLHNRGIYTFYINELLSPDQFEIRQWRPTWITVQRGDTWNLRNRLGETAEQKRVEQYKSNTEWLSAQQH